MGLMSEKRTPDRSESPNLAGPSLAASEAETLVGNDHPGEERPGNRLPRGTTVGRYVVLDPLGAGGMGVVYAAFDPQLDRRIALKMLRPDPDGSSGSSGGPERLLREAQAMARLNHPNVISVHDVGTFEGEVFVAMEFVDGQTLSQWSERARRPWREVLRVFREAGAGLAAAHRAGIVHRDFKPDNVMVGPDGRVHVLDFGLARPHGPTVATPTEELELSDETDRSVSLDTRLTQTGALLGTPAYMAPEQHSGKETSAMSDQFSFCVALYEGLYGERPFRGESTASLAFNVLRGKLREPPSDAKVPRWVRRALVRGLAVNEAERFESMDQLLAELGRDPDASRRRWFGVVALAATVGTGAYAVGAIGDDPGSICAAADEHMTGVWDEESRKEAQAAFVASGLSYAPDAWDRTQKVLDHYAEAWKAMHVDACEATHIRGEQSERLLDLRMSCLESSRQQLLAASKLLSEADAKTVRRSYRLAAGLPKLSACADIQLLNAGADPPADDQKRAVAQVRAQLAEIAALVDAGRYETGLSAAQTAVEQAEGVDYPPLAAEAGFWLGYLQEKNGDAQIAAQTLSDAAFGAQAARHDVVAARAMTVLVFVVGDRLAQTDQALDWARHARASVSRLNDPLAEAELLNNEGTVLITAGRYQEAQTTLTKALELREAELGPDHYLVGRTLSNLATAYDDQGKIEEARTNYERSLAIAEATFGAGHPDLAIRLTNFGEMLARAGDRVTAREYSERAVELFANSVGKKHHYYASALNNLATVEVADGQYERAMQLMQETKAVWIALQGPEHPDVALTDLNIGSIAQKLGHDDEAKKHLEAALDIYTKSFGPEHPDVGSVLDGLGTIFRDGGEREKALDYHRRAAAIFEKQGPEHPELRSSLKGVALDLLALDRAEEAIEPLERSIRLYEDAGADRDELGALRFDLAQALWETRRDRLRARTLMVTASEDFDAMQQGDDAADARDWLSTHH